MQAVSPLLQDIQTEEEGRPCFRSGADSGCWRWRRGLWSLFLGNNFINTQRQGLCERQQGRQHETCTSGASVRR